MQRCGAFTRRDIGEGFLPSMLLCVFLVAASGAPAYAADDPTACRTPVARVVSIQGSIELGRSGQSNWSKVTRLDTPLCEGDRLRTGALSRTALFIQPETLVRVDQNTSISISQTAEETLVEFTQEDIVAASATAHACGAGYFITRFPRKFKVRTPHLNAAVEGTEFLVAMRCEATELSVFEGKVLAEGAGANIFSAQSISSGQTLTIGGAEPPAIKLQIKPKDAVQWTLYYPPITPAGVVPAEDCRVVAPDNRASCLIARAEQRLRAGRVEEAQASIGDALAAAPYSSDAKALSSVISLVRNDKAEALRLAWEAVEANANSAPAWLALSYAQQADFKLEASLTSAKRASELTPSSALAFARVAELQLSLGWTREAEKTATQAVAANPSESRAHMILGFVHLAQINVKTARQDFGRAIALDSTDPLSRLGLGLAVIREGKLVEGREQIVIAVALDPTNALIRSYVGKAYYEENTKERDQLSSTQLGLAKQLDPNDPTPWFYAAVLRQTQNRPVEALEELQESIERNDDRAIYRSRLLLDDDAAARTSSVVAIYGNLGFEKLAIVESAKVLGENAGDYSAHRQLAFAYSNLPRHDIARESEALQAQIRQPVSALPASSQLTGENFPLVKDTGPSQLGANEYNLLFNRDQVRLQGDGVMGSQGTRGNKIVVSGLHGKVAYALSQMHYKTEGFVDNDASEKTVYDFFVHGQMLPNSTIQANIKQADLAVGQTFFPFDPLFTTLQTTIIEKSDSFRLSGHHVIDTGADWIWSLSQENLYRTVNFTPDSSLLTKTEAEAYSGELQYLNRFARGQVVIGVTRITEDDRFPVEQSDLRIRASNLYTYSQWRPTQRDLTLHLGFAAESFYLKNYFFTHAIERDRISPKLGLVWSPVVGTTLRTAAFSNVRRPLIRSQTIEPTQIAGFNQFFTGFEQIFGDQEGIISERVGLALDQQLSGTAFMGVELAGRRLYVPSLNLERDTKWRESTAHLYVYKNMVPVIDGLTLPGWQAAVSLEGEYERIERPQILTGAEGIIELETVRVPVGIRLFNNAGFTMRLVNTYVEQDAVLSADVGLAIVPKKDSTWVTDVSLEYRLPRRLGTLAVGVKNLSDNFIDVLETDPLNPRVATRRFVFGRISLLL